MEQEYAIISAVLKTPNRIGSVNLSADDFSDPSCATVWDAMLEVSRHSPVDLITVTEHLSKKTGQEWVATVGRMANHPSSPANLDAYLKNQHASALQRKARDICAKAAYSEGDIDVDSLTSDLMALARRDDRGLKSLKDALNEAYKALDDAVNSSGTPGIETGYASFDEFLGGYHKSDLIVIAGRPAMGKTALLISMIMKCAARAFLVSGEMASVQVGGRVISMSSGVPATQIRNGQMNCGDWPKITSGFQKALQRKCWIYDKPGPTIQEVMQSARLAKHEHDIEIVYVDYIQKIRSANKSNRVDEIEDVVMGLKDLARELEVPVISLAQVNRECEKRNDRRPVMSDLKGAGAIEQEADAIAFIYRDHVYNDNADPSDTEILWEKNRHGPTGTMRIHWSPQTMTFSDYTNVYGG